MQRDIIKSTLQLLFLLVASITGLLTTACSDSSDNNNDNDSANHYDLSGTWYGTRYYINNSAVKYQYITLSLNSDKTGSMEYEAPESFSAAKFTWKVNGDKLICTGAYANTYGEVSGDYTLECRIENDRLIPLNQYSVFILTKDNSVMTDGDGNEVINPEDQVYMLQNVWVAEDKTSVIEFYPGGEYDEYVLTSPGAKDFSEFHTGKYQFDPLHKTLTINTSLWNVVNLNETSLILQRDSRRMAYKIGSRANIPTQSDIKAYLISTFMWSDSRSKYSFRFTDDGTVIYTENSGKRYGSYGEIVLRADGYYSVSGSTVTCNFTEVSWEYGATGTANWFPGWKYESACIKKYIVKVCPSSSIEVTFPDSKVIYFDKY